MKTVLVLDLLHYAAHPTLHRNGVTPTALEEANLLSRRYNVIFGCCGSDLKALSKAYPSLEFVNLCPVTYESLYLGGISKGTAKRHFVGTVVTSIRKLAKRIDYIASSSQYMVLTGLDKANLEIPTVYTLHFYAQPNLMFHGSTASKFLRLKANSNVLFVANTSYTRWCHQRQTLASYKKGLIRPNAIELVERFKGDYCDAHLDRMVSCEGVQRISVSKETNGRLIVASRVHKEKNLPFCAVSKDIDFHLLVPPQLDKELATIKTKLDSLGASVKANTPHDKLFPLIAKSSGLIVSCTFETFARTAFEAACVGTPSLLFVDKTGRHAVKSWSEPANIEFDTFNFSELSQRKERFLEAIEQLKARWTYSKRVALERKMRSHFSADNFLNERDKLFQLATAKLNKRTKLKSRGDLFK